MKIKTIWDTRPDRFDDTVNRYLEEGMTLTRREVIPDTNDLDKSALYAELVQLDPEPEAPPEPQPLDPIACLEALRKFCAGSKCEGCPLEDWCPVWLPRNEGPADWEIPGEEAGL